MINANELRIGNIIWESNSFTPGLEDFDEIIVASINDIDKAVRDDQGNGYSYDALYPIPITQDRLIELGFHKFEQVIGTYEDELQYSYRDHKLELTFTVAYVIDRSGADVTRIRIRLDGEVLFTPKSIIHVHQLQNLYFALTGEELEIKP
jgi:hypothetical protein